MRNSAVEAICELLRQQPRSDHRWIGLEVERLVVDGGQSGGQSNFGGPGDFRGQRILHYRDAIAGLLEALVKEKKWAVDYEVDGHILGLKRNLHAISLEPGGQFEVSAAPRKTISEVKRLQEEIDSEIFSLPLTRGWGFLEIGANPIERADEIELLPSPRYKLMDQYFQTSGTRGREMMRLTTGTQVNLDFETPKEAVCLLRSAFLITPVLATIFSNSPYRHRNATGNLSERHHIWLDTDRARSGIPAAVFDEDFSLTHYAEYISKIPLMYAYGADGNVIDPKGKSFAELPENLKNANALACMRQLFAEVRLKPCCVEVRCFDQTSAADRYAAVAMTVGLLYDDENRKRIQESLRDVTSETLRAWMKKGSEEGLKSEPLYPLALQFFKWAEEGLVRRGFGEEEFLSPAEEILRKTITPAERLLRDWGDHL